jgi:hypothetical protein
LRDGNFISGKAIFQVGCLLIFKNIIQIMGLRVFENRVSRYIFKTKRNEVRTEWGRLHNKEHHGMYTSTVIIWVIKSRRRQVRHIACRGKESVLMGKLSERPLGNRQ